MRDMGGNNLGGGVFNAQKRNNNNLQGQQRRAEIVDFCLLFNFFIGKSLYTYRWLFLCTSSSQQRAGCLLGMRSQKHQHAILG